MKSIRATLMLWLLCGLAAIMIAGGAVLFLGVRRALIRQFDETLAARIATLVSATGWDADGLEIDFFVEQMPWYGPGPKPEYFEVLDLSSGAEPRVFLKSPSFGDEGFAAAPRSGAGHWDITLPDHRPGRALSSLYQPPPDHTIDPEDALDPEEKPATGEAPELLLIVAKGREDLDRTLRALGAALAAAGVGMGLGVVALVRVALSRGLRPLARLSAEVEAIEAESLTHRLNGVLIPRELRPIYGRLNDLFGRLSNAFERERRFTAAAAHELRTPIAELRTLLEVSLSRPRSAEEGRRTAAESLAVTTQMERLVSSLFELARRDPGQAAAGPVDAVNALRRVCARHQPRAAARGGEVRLEGPARALVLADESLLEAILENVIANAVQHALPRPVVKVSMAPAEPGRFRIDVANPAHGLNEADLERFFEPFWRQSESRSDRDHLGLGLSVARRLAEHMGGSLTASLPALGVVRVSLVLRAAPSSGGGGAAAHR